MAAIEIDENELAQYKAIASQVQLWMGNPEARRKVLEARKLIDPNAVIPELDAAKPINDAVSKLDEKIAALDKKLDEDKAAREEAKKLGELQSRWNKGRSALQNQGYTSEGIEKIEKLMEERGIADHDAGAALFDKLNPPEQPISPQNSGFDMLKESFMPGQDEAAEADRKALFENPDAWLNGAVGKTLKDIRSK